MSLMTMKKVKKAITRLSGEVGPLGGSLAAEHPSP